MINHLVLFKVKEDIDNEAIETLENKFFELKKGIPEILDMTGGKNISSEGFDKGFSRGYVLQFSNTSDLQRYLHAEEHRNFVELYVSKTVDEVIVFDYCVPGPKKRNI